MLIEEYWPNQAQLLPRRFASLLTVSRTPPMRLYKIPSSEFFSMEFAGLLHRDPP